MIKIQDKNAKLFLSLVFGALIVVGLMITTRPKNSENPSTSATITSRVYSNDLLDFSVVVPADFSVKTIAGFADFEKNNLKINQFRNCTNY